MSSSLSGRMGVSRKKKVVEYFNEEREKERFISKYRNEHLQWDKLKRKGGYLE